MEEEEAAANVPRKRPLFIRVMLLFIPHMALVAVFFCYLFIGAAIFMELESEHGDLQEVENDKKHLKEMMEEIHNCTRIHICAENTGVSDGSMGQSVVTPGRNGTSTTDRDQMPGQMTSNSGQGKGKGQGHPKCKSTDDIYDHMMYLEQKPEWKLARMQSVQANRTWNWTSAMLFCFTTITTIGYGDVVPVTTAGQMAVIAYSIIGIPLTLLLLADTGNLLGKSILVICRYIHPSIVIIRIRQDALCTCFRVSSRHRPDQDGNWSSSQHANRGASLSSGLAQSQLSLGSINKLQTYEDSSMSTVVKQSDKFSNTIPRGFNQSLSGQTNSSNGIREDLYSPTSWKGSQDMSCVFSNASGQNEAGQTTFMQDHKEVCEEVMAMSDDIVMEEVPITIVSLIFVAYTVISAECLVYVEGWSFTKALYFTFITLTTIGFGDVLPTNHYEEGEFFSVTVFLMFGLAVNSMCISLVQAKVVRSCKKMATKLGF